MSSRIATFEKVSFERFKEDWMDKNPTSHVDVDHSLSEWTEAELRELYDGIQMPRRGTSGSAGYDIYAVTDIYIPHGEAVVIPTGLRCKIEDGWFLDLNPRSGHGFKYGIRLANTRGIIDSDYYGADNEGHIMIKIVNDAPWAPKSIFHIMAGSAFAQGIFTVYGITTDDDADTIRTGGFGSTG